MAISIRREHSSVNARPQLEVSAAPAPEAGRARLAQIALAGLRVISGLMFMQHGMQKLFGMFVDPSRPPMPHPAMFSQFWFAGVLETFGGALIVLGLLTRPVAFLLAGEMAVAYFQMHFPKNFFPILNGGEPAVLYCWIFLAFAALGGGTYSVDELWRRRTVVGR